MSQNITLVLPQDLYNEYIHDLDTSMYYIIKNTNDENKLKVELKQMIESKRNINKSRSSMDLHTCT